MLFQDDMDFAVRLERAINKILHGDEKQIGLYRVLKSAGNWGEYQHLVGRIEAYEAVQEEMQIIAKAMNDNQRGTGTNG